MLERKLPIGTVTVCLHLENRKFKLFFEKPATFQANLGFDFSFCLGKMCKKIKKDKKVFFVTPSRCPERVASAQFTSSFVLIDLSRRKEIYDERGKNGPLLRCVFRGL